MTRQFHLDMAAAHGKGAGAVDKALQAAFLAEAARLPADPVVPPVPATPHGPRPFSDASPFNTPLTGSEKWVPLPVPIPYLWVDNKAANVVYAHITDPVFTFVGPAYVALDYHRNRPAKTMTVRAPATLKAGLDSDRILVLVQPDGTYLEVWQTIVDLSKRTITSGPKDVGWAEGNIVTGPGAGTLANNDGVRASNFSWAAGLISPADLAAGVIDHALVFATPKISTGPTAYRAPATAWEDTGDGGFKLGDKIGIPPGITMPATLSKPTGPMAWNALQKYGAYCGDFAGGDAQLYADATVTNAQIGPLVDNWDGHPSDLDLILPFLRLVA